MNFFPGLYQTRTVKKTISFSNPLTGQIYNNKNFIRNIDQQTRQSNRTFNQNNSKNSKLNGQLSNNHNRNKSFTSSKNQMRQLQKEKIQRQIKAISTTTRLAKSKKNNLLCRRSQLINCQDTSGYIKSNEMSKTAPLKPLPFSSFQNTNIKRRKQFKEEKQSEEVFHDIQVLILDIINEYDDLQTKIVRMNLQKYFRSFFKKQLTGAYTKQFLQKVQQYLKHVINQKSYSQIVDQKNYSSQIFSIITRISFLSKIYQLQARNSQYGFKNILGMIRYYCIPTEQFRQSCLRDINLMLSLQIYQKFNCNKNEEYVLLNQKGKQIQDIVQIVFSTKRLFFTKKTKAVFNYNRYLKMLNEYQNSHQKFSFNEGLKYSFRKNIAKGNYDQTQINYAEDPQNFTLKRKEDIQKAEIILKRKTLINKINCNNIQGSSINQSFHEDIKNIDQNQTSFNQNLKNTQHQNIFWKQGSKFISPQVSPRNRSKSPKHRSQISPKRSASPLKQKQISKQKFKSLISFEKGNELTKRLQQKFLAEYKILVSQNDFYDISFNHRHQNKLSYQSWRNNFVYFKQKSQRQVKKIVEALFQICQIQKLSETVGNQKKQIYFGFDEYKKIRCIIQCFQPVQNIMKFVALYLNFNEYGQLTKNQLYQQIKIILEESQTGVVQVILQVIWSWFQSNSVLDNKVIRRLVLESWFQKYKIVYCMLVSLIFGTNHTTALDLAYQILH